MFLVCENYFVTTVFCIFNLTSTIFVVFKNVMILNIIIMTLKNLRLKHNIFNLQSKTCEHSSISKSKLYCHIAALGKMKYPIYDWLSKHAM